MRCLTCLRVKGCAEWCPNHPPMTRIMPSVPDESPVEPPVRGVDGPTWALLFIALGVVLIGLAFIGLGAFSLWEGGEFV